VKKLVTTPSHGSLPVVTATAATAAHVSNVRVRSATWDSAQAPPESSTSAAVKANSATTTTTAAAAASTTAARKRASDEISTEPVVDAKRAKRAIAKTNKRARGAANAENAVN
jgi:hypothetical protein